MGCNFFEVGGFSRQTHSTMKSISILTSIASAALGAFVLGIGIGYVSLTLFLGAAIAWVLLLTVYAYTPRERSWLPKRAKVAAVDGAQSSRQDYTLAA
jgi:archaellum biogenesis protein FlaJ (TadC family)